MKKSIIIKEEVKPFLKEWKELSKGIVRPIKIGPYRFKVLFWWEEANMPSYRIYGKYKDDALLMEDVIPKSKEYQKFKKRIDTFLDKTEDYGKKYHKCADYLWHGYFWINE